MQQLASSEGESQEGMLGCISPVLWPCWKALSICKKQYRRATSFGTVKGSRFTAKAFPVPWGHGAQTERCSSAYVEIYRVSRAQDGRRNRGLEA